MLHASRRSQLGTVFTDHQITNVFHAYSKKVAITGITGYTWRYLSWPPPINENNMVIYRFNKEIPWHATGNPFPWPKFQFLLYSPWQSAAARQKRSPVVFAFLFRPGWKGKIKFPMQVGDRSMNRVPVKWVEHSVPQTVVICVPIGRFHHNLHQIIAKLWMRISVLRSVQNPYVTTTMVS